jgi:NAD(P)H dehydrogenase (quinone)
LGEITTYGEGGVPTFHAQTGRKLPTVAAGDVGRVAGELLLEGNGNGVVGAGGRVRVVHVEGPTRYSDEDIVNAIGKVLGRKVNLAVVPRDKWMETLQRGMGRSVAELLVGANDAVNEGGLVDAEEGGEVRRGKIELVEALREMVGRLS